METPIWWLCCTKTAPISMAGPRRRFAVRLDSSTPVGLAIFAGIERTERKMVRNSKGIGEFMGFSVEFRRFRWSAEKTFGSSLLASKAEHDCPKNVEARKHWTPVLYPSIFHPDTGMLLTIGAVPAPDTGHLPMMLTLPVARWKAQNLLAMPNPTSARARIYWQK